MYRFIIELICWASLHTVQSKLESSQMHSLQKENPKWKCWIWIPRILGFQIHRLDKKCFKMENHFGRNHLWRQQPITLLICVAQTEIELVERVARVPSISYQSNQAVTPNMGACHFFFVTPNMGACHTLAPLYRLWGHIARHVSWLLTWIHRMNAP